MKFVGWRIRAEYKRKIRGRSYENGEYSIMGLNLEWKRFTTWNMNDYMEFEIDLVKKLTPDPPVTTNFMQLYDGLDYRKMTDKLDVIS